MKVLVEQLRAAHISLPCQAPIVTGMQCSASVLELALSCLCMFVVTLMLLVSHVILGCMGCRGSASQTVSSILTMLS